MARIKTRILILSDTHGHLPSRASAADELTAASDFSVAVTGYRLPLPAADVALHCGDLTTRSTPDELRRTLSVLRGLRAPLKVVIPGNHDRLLDAAHWSRDDGYGYGYRDPEYRTEALELLEDAKADGVVYLGGDGGGGAHEFRLANGALLRLYASPWTPEYGVWGFQYPPEDGHDFRIPAGVDVAMTHGPPRGVLDLAGFALPAYGLEPSRAGCGHLLAAVARARPRLHCFGHIHEAWGAYLARWKPATTTTTAAAEDDEHDDAETAARHNTTTTTNNNTTTTSTTMSTVTAENAIDAAASRSIVALQEIKPMTFLDPPATPAQAARLMDWSAQMGVHIDWEAEESKAREGQQAGQEEKEEEEEGKRQYTLFVNAAIQGFREKPSQLPYIVDMLLDEAPPSET
ncbi:hypothetical protein V2A60_010163 [Cordyceps javanica]|uniref:Metallophosphoesterase n=1 Tax=Cordyceps javanica TaxID=43265 RepID=A0A545VU25_9HYPO|nr:Metallophosphoesterase [Cordyceps javanica]TQW05223.1 Metallophosphoesterase [Cordyceps javanica]